MHVLKYLQLPFVFNAALLQKEVGGLSNNIQWVNHYQTLHYEGEWSAIPLRSVGGSADNIIIHPTQDVTYKDTVYLKRCPYIQQVLQKFACPLKEVRLLKLDAGAIIKDHRDVELNFESGEIRLHIPVVTHPDVEFYLDNERMDLKEGECWYMNFNLPHRISNNSPVNRVHLVIDAEVNDWVKELFTNSAIVVKKETEDFSAEHSPEVKRQMIIRFREMNTLIANQLADALEIELGAMS